MASFNQSLVNAITSKYGMTLTSTSYLGVRPGDIVVVTYPRKSPTGVVRRNLTRLGFIMSSSKSSDGIKLSSQLNMLLNFVDVEGISDEAFVDIVDRLYTKELTPRVEEFAYAVNADIGDFKTFNVLEISGTGVFKINLHDNETLQ